MKKTVKKKDTASIINVLVQSINDMSFKLNRIGKDVTNNSKDISQIKQQISFSKGAVKVLIWLVGTLTTVIAILKFTDF
tara:strand:+ start:552 stop:788 length:237 start_codon:yes stop_codon:yes gene_type:complete